MTGRRGFLIGLGAALASPSIVRAESLMKIASLRNSIIPTIKMLTDFQIGSDFDITRLDVLYGYLRVNPQWESEFAKAGAKIGQTLRIRLPSDYTQKYLANADLDS